MELTDLTSNAFAGYSIDSRLVRPGELFIALKGEKTDGHLYLEEVALKGARAALVDANYSGESYGLKLFRSADTLFTLQDLARRYLDAFGPLQVVAITGSVGKTSTKEYLARILSERFRVAQTPGNCNSQVSLPLTILNGLKPETEVFVLEMGMSVKGNLKKLVSIAPPDIAILTAVAAVHAENFSSLEEIAHTKAEIFTHPKTRLGILPVAWAEALASFGSCPKKSFALSGTADFVWSGTAPLPRHHLSNVAAAILSALELGMTEEEIARALPHLKLPPKRMETIEKEGIKWILDAYNSSALAAKGALDSLSQERGRRIAVLGEMRELGKFSAAEHGAVGSYALERVDVLFTLGNETLPLYEVWKKAGKEAYFTHDINDLKKLLDRHLCPGDAVLVKGSNSLKMWELV